MSRKSTEYILSDYSEKKGYHHSMLVSLMIDTRKKKKNVRIKVTHHRST